jgi:AraC-like DNA-binding protein
VDAVAGLLDGPRAHDAFLLRCVMAPPWSLQVEDEAPLAAIAQFTGESWIAPVDGEPVLLEPGDVALVRGPGHYLIADDPSTPPQAIIHPGNRCTTVAGEDLAERMGLGVRTWGNAPDGPTVLLVGCYELRGEISRRLLDTLPPLLVLRAADWDTPVLDLLSQEIVKDAPGQAAVLDRLLDLLVIAVLRAWFARPEAEAPAWYRAHADPVVGRALRLLENSPGSPWTVASLAAEAGLSRAALARRFNELVGEPPMTYLTQWRIALAADLLREPGATIGSVAQQVGYGSPFALSTAFKRVRGVSPQQHRASAA